MTTNRFPSYLLLAALLGMADVSLTRAADLVVGLSGVPADGTLVFQLYNDPDAFGRFRDPAREVSLPSRGNGEYRLPDVKPEEIALLVYFDQNGNAILDRNFIGIPRELIGLSRNYRPKGPPSFERASFTVNGGRDQNLEIEMYQVLGERGQFGVGLGVIGRGSPYVDSTRSVSQLIPAVTYIGKRLQWLGPELNFGLAGSGATRLALTAEYRIGTYEAEDSPVLADLGDRESTLMLGLGLELDLPRGFEIEAGYRHDALDRIGGGVAELELSRGFQAGLVRISPQLSVTWASSDVANHDFGVPEQAATLVRPAYSPGDTTTLGIGVTGIAELSENWRAILSITTEFLDSKARKSPIVEEESVVAGFAALTYAF
jgi:outer membrane protein